MRSAARSRSSANALLIGKLLAVLDDFDRALDNVPPDTDDSWVEGVRLVERKLRSVLESEGVTPIEAVGQPFDPECPRGRRPRGDGRPSR